jgi:hypothetical protein
MRIIQNNTLEYFNSIIVTLLFFNMLNKLFNRWDVIWMNIIESEWLLLMFRYTYIFKDSHHCNEYIINYTGAFYLGPREK